MIRPVLLLALCTGAALRAWSPVPAPPTTGRVVAIGDIHGSLDGLTGILQRVGVVDAQLKWSGGDATLVQTGDIIDRGPKSRDVMDLLMTLQQEAPKQGGRVIVLMGNHEAMNVYGDWKYVTAADYAAFVDGESEHRRRTALAAARQAKRAPADEAAWLRDHPAGFIERVQAFGPDGKYGRWLRTLPAVVAVNGSLFVHGGLSPELGSWKLARINDTIASEVRTFDAAKRQLLAAKLVLPFDTIIDLIRGASASTAPTSTNVLRLRDFDNWLSVNDSGPLWFRGYARWTDAEGDELAKVIVESAGVSRIVSGHTVQTGQIASRFGGRVYLIDTGMFAGAFPGGRASALTIDNGVVNMVYAGDGRATRSP